MWIRTASGVVGGCPCYFLPLYLYRERTAFLTEMSLAASTRIIKAWYYVTSRDDIAIGPITRPQSKGVRLYSHLLQTRLSVQPPTPNQSRHARIQTRVGKRGYCTRNISTRAAPISQTHQLKLKLWRNIKQPEVSSLRFHFISIKSD